MLVSISEVKVDNVFDLNSMRRIKGIERAIKQFEKQIADIKAAKGILARHTEYRFFSIMCHELTAEQKNLKIELDKLNQRLNTYKRSYNSETKEEVNE